MQPGDASENNSFKPGLGIVEFQTIYYTCDDDRFPVFGSLLASANTALLFSRETGVNPGVRS
jgi:hypothetical protein